MAYVISDDCVSCGTCAAECPADAIPRYADDVSEQPADHAAAYAVRHANDAAEQSAVDATTDAVSGYADDAERTYAAEC